jgi:hypothetical protein
MSDLETEFSDSSQHFAQAGTLVDPSLSQLRDQIKKVMIPLLIKTFQFKLELSQSLSLPSRLRSQKNQRSPEEILEHLKILDSDLKILLLWCQSCRSQIQKALSVSDEDQKPPVTTAVPSSANTAVTKSFSEAVSAQASFFKQPTAPEKAPELFTDMSCPSPPKPWWKKLLGK